MRQAAFRNFDVAASRACLIEYRTTIWSPSKMERYRRYRIDTRTVKKVLDGFTNALRLVEDGGRYCEIPTDPSDEKFTAAAIRASAEFIVSEDDHLLGLGECEGIPVVRAGAFVREMQRRGVTL